MLAFQLQVGGLEQLALGYAAAESLAEHAQLGLTNIALPARQLFRAEALKPAHFPGRKRDRLDRPGSTLGQLLQSAQLALQLLLDRQTGLLVHDLNSGAG